MIKKKLKKVKVTASKPTSTVLSEVTSTSGATSIVGVKPPLIGKLTLSFPNEDLNKLVEKINEIIEHTCH